MELKAQEVAEVLRKAIAGEIPIRLACPERTWDGTYAGDVEFWFGDWYLVIFNDCDELDYVDCAVAPDGRAGDLFPWMDAGPEPVECLTWDERKALEKVLKEAR